MVEESTAALGACGTGIPANMNTLQFGEATSDPHRPTNKTVPPTYDIGTHQPKVVESRRRPGAPRKRIGRRDGELAWEWLGVEDSFTSSRQGEEVEVDTWMRA